MTVQTTYKSGIVTIHDDKVSYTLGNELLFTLSSNDIAIIGEFTNNNGPILDDWFLVLVTKNGNWQSISLYAADIDNLIKYLKDKFGTDLIIPNLANSTEWKSIVCYPAHFLGRPLFKLAPTKNYRKAITFFDKLLNSVGLGGFDTTEYIILSDEVEAELKIASR